MTNRFEKSFGGKTLMYRSSSKGLRIPFAVGVDGKIVDLKIGDYLSSHGFICGAVGSGKSALLHMIITSAVMHYHPSELELWLVDYKITEFSFYMRNCPPHVRYVVADSSSEISYSILDEIKEEIRRRNRVFESAGAKDYVEYRECRYSKDNHMPRILILIDEFHRMSYAMQNESNYKIILKDILFEACHAGISLLFCDQQFPNALLGLSQIISVRISLKNMEDEIRETLDIGKVQITDDERKMILELKSGTTGDAIYKYEENRPKEFTTGIVLKRCRVIFVDSKKRAEVIGESIEKFPHFAREKIFFTGAEQYHMGKRGDQNEN